MALSSKFGCNARIVQSVDRPLTDQQIMGVAPSIFAGQPHGSRSERYAYIPTIDVLDGLRKEGFEPFFACQTRTRKADRVGHTKHMLRLRPVGQLHQPEVNEIILLNSHDGTSSYQLIAGCFRFVCHNGMVCGETHSDIRIRHKGDVVGEVIEGAYSVVDNFARIDENRDMMKSIMLPAPAQKALAAAAIEYKWGDAGQEGGQEGGQGTRKVLPVTPEQVLRPRRYEDRQDDLWTTFNRIQENLMKGGLQGRTAKGRRRQTRAVTGIDGDVKLNRALWTMAESMADYFK